MKDYLLSEIKEICKQLHAEYGDCACDECYIGTMCWKVCDESIPKDWDDIEPRDMIELPRKEEFEFVQNCGMVRHWRVYYLDKENNNIMRHQYFLSEFEADEFIKKLKEGNQ